MQALDYVMYADRFGWTPAEVDAIPLTTEMWLLPVHDVIEGVRRDAQQRASSGS